MKFFKVVFYYSNLDRRLHSNMRMTAKDKHLFIFFIVVLVQSFYVVSCRLVTPCHIYISSEALTFILTPTMIPSKELVVTGLLLSLDNRCVLTLVILTVADCLLILCR